MNNSIQVRILAATKLCLRPVARMLLRAGINYRQFSEIAKLAFLEEALSERDSRGRRPNLSRIAVRTGLSRKEVAKTRHLMAADKAHGRESAGIGNRSGLAARVLQLWHSDPAYTESAGAPRELHFSGERGSFSALVKLAGGDVPPGAVRAELVSANAVVEGVSGQLRATKRHFVPGDVDEDMVVGLTHIVYPVVEGLARNTGPLKADPFVQRLAYSDRLPSVAIPHFRNVASDRCADFVQSMDDWITANERSPDEQVVEGHRVAVGVFYFEGAPPHVSQEHELGSDNAQR